MTIAYVGIGSNLEQPVHQVDRALHELAAIRNSRLTARSSLYRSAPMGFAAQPDFVNAVAALETSLSPGELLAELEAIEKRHGRERAFANAPRTLDLDLLLFAQTTVHSAGLILPHPRMHERAFVLEPLLEIAPDAHIPGIGFAREQLARCAGQRIERLP